MDLNFVLITWSKCRKIDNSGVYIRANSNDKNEYDYHDTLVEILELQYPESDINRVMLFNYK